MGFNDINPLDRRFWPDNPDPDFSPQKNKAVVERTVEKYEKMRAKKFVEFRDGLKERTDAIASYLKKVVGDKKGRTLEQYFGRRYLAKLRGEEIRDELRERLSFVGQPQSLVITDKKGKLKGKNVQQKKKNKVE